jgi:hypothetical protein
VRFGDQAVQVRLQHIAGILAHLLSK